MHEEQLKKVAAGKMFDAYAAALCDDIVALADRLNMKLYTPLSHSGARSNINGTAPLIYPMQLHPHYQLSNAGRQKLKM